MLFMACGSAFVIVGSESRDAPALCAPNGGGPRMASAPSDEVRAFRHRFDISSFM